MKEVYGVQSHIQPTWYNDLMSECNVHEVRHLFVKTKYVVSPGVDKVSAGIWKLGCEQSEDVCWAVCVMLNACLRLRMMPSLGKKSIIVPILKNEHGEKELSNIRPISLQTALTKLLSKLLADRLGAIFAKHPILHKAQEGFVVGGSVVKCIDVCLDIWEMAKKKKRGCYNLFYDIKAAYDSVRHSDLLRALRRLALPEGFVELVAHSLSGLTSCVRTVFGPTEDFAVKKSVRQGDPLAPLLFVILMDPLHCGLAKNPLYEGAQEGFKVTKEIQVASKGLADDTWIVSESKDGLTRMHEWVLEFVKVNHLALHPKKTELVGAEPNGDSMVNSTNIGIEDHVLEPSLGSNGTSQCLRYLGISMCMQLEWKYQVNAITKTLNRYCHLGEKYKLSVKHLVHFFNIYLLPKIEYGLKYVQCGLDTFKKWDVRLVKSVCHVSQLSMRLGRSAVSAITGLRLPSQLHALSTIGEAFVRLNSNSEWGEIGRGRYMHGIGDGSRVASRDHCNRLVKVHADLVALGWSTVRVDHKSRGVGSWNDVVNVPGTSLCKHMTLHDQSVPVLLDMHYGSWGARMDPACVRVFTDGSSSVQRSCPSEEKSTSAWGLCFGDDWFEAHYDSLPDEQHVTWSSIKAGSVFGGFIEQEVSQGIFMAELQGVARALNALPYTWEVQVVLDSKAALQAIQAYLVQVNERKRLRSKGRPMLEWISKMMTCRKLLGGEVTWTHVKSHAKAGHSRTMDEVGNSCADYIAGHARVHGDQSVGKAFPLHLGEYWLSVKDEQGMWIANDIRAQVKVRSKALCMESWQASPSQGLFAGTSVLPLCNMFFFFFC